MNKIKTGLFILIITLLSGCAVATKYSVTVDSINSQMSESKKAYTILSGLKGVVPTDLQFSEYAAYVERALSARGFTKAERIEEANVLIFLAYGIGDPQENVYTYAVPVWGQTGTSSSNTHGTVNSFGNSASYSSTTTYTPTYGITGFMPMVGSNITYFRFLVLDAINYDEYKQSQKIVPLWQTIVTSTGSSGDLRSVLPVLVAASKPYIGNNTRKKVNFQMAEDDRAVMEIKK